MYNNTIDRLDKYASAHGLPIEFFHENTPAGVFTIPPITIGDVHEKYAEYLEPSKVVNKGPFYVTELPEVKVTGCNDVGSIQVYTVDNRLIKSVSTSYTFAPEPTYTTHSLRGKTVLLCVDSMPVYYHWMVQVLPRIELLRLYGIEWSEIDHILVSHQLDSRFIEDTTAKLGIPTEKFVHVGRGDIYQCEHLIIPSKASVHIHTPQWAWDYLRSTFLSQSTKTYSDKIYITRRNAGKRRLVNEEQVLNILKPLGYAVMYMEDHSVEEQARIFNAASTIICPHGAALANLVYCKPGTQILEFFSPSYVFTLYWSVACDMDLVYYYLIGNGEVNIDPIIGGGSDDISVNINQFNSILGELG